MWLIRCTKKLRQEMGLTDGLIASPLSVPVTSLFEWYAEYQNSLRVTQVVDYVLSEVIAHAICIPTRTMEEILKSSRVFRSGCFSDLPTILAFYRSNQGFEIFCCSLLNLRSKESRCNLLSQIFQVLGSGV